ncbi:hypothetical protein T06_14273 [Trichinella sp. T6]|nr:hypothetical protein T06_14273 [Trichinella sp. T6]
MQTLEQTLRVGAHIANSTGIRSRAFGLRVKNVISVKDKTYKNSPCYLRNLASLQTENTLRASWNRKLTVSGFTPQLGSDLTHTLWGLYIHRHEHFTSVLVSPIQPVSDYVHSAVSVPIGHSQFTSRKHIASFVEIEKRMLSALHPCVGSDCTNTLWTQYKLRNEHFTSVLILRFQPVSDHVHSAVSVPMANVVLKIYK